MLLRWRRRQWILVIRRSASLPSRLTLLPMRISRRCWMLAARVRFPAPSSSIPECCSFQPHSSSVDHDPLRSPFRAVTRQHEAAALLLSHVLCGVDVVALPLSAPRTGVCRNDLENLLPSVPPRGTQLHVVQPAPALLGRYYSTHVPRV